MADSGRRGEGFGHSRALPEMSNTTGGRSARGMQRLLAGQPLSPGGHLAGQLVEGSVQGLTPRFQRSELLYRGQSKIPFCLAVQRATQRITVVSMRSLQAREGEVRPGEVVSTRSSDGFLADAGSGRFK